MELIMKRVGVYICRVLDAGFVLLAWYMSTWVNGIPVEMFTFLGIVLSGANVLVKYIIQRIFKISEDDFLDQKLIE